MLASKDPPDTVQSGKPKTAAIRAPRLGDRDAPPPETERVRSLRRIGRLAYQALALVLLCLAAFVLWREFHRLRLDEVEAAIAAWGWRSVASAIALSTTSFLLMGCVEWLALRWAGARVGLGRALAGSFMGSAIAHSLGANLLVSGAVRAKYYARHGVSLRQVAAATLFDGFSFAVGLSTVAGLALLLAGSREIAAYSRIANPVADAAGALLLTGVAGYVVLCGAVRRPVRALGHDVQLPSARVALAQIILGAVDNTVASAIIWVLLPPGSIGFPAFVSGYAPSVVLGLISHVPGGVGVFEGSLSTLTKGIAPAALAAAFLGYRLFFFLLPLLLAGLALAYDTLRRRPQS